MMKTPDVSELLQPVESPIILVKGVSKRYVRRQYRTSLRQEGMNVVRSLFQRPAKVDDEAFYAVRDVSFAVKRGEAVGVIGRNGSGKTTLLRLLSGITHPTSGSIDVRGRFGSIIGLATGFMTELTGRENIYLVAAMQGVNPKVVQPLVEPIIEFAELSHVIDARVRQYSSGMFARLGFSILIHIVPEVIFVDEALAVGDLAFQQKCLERLHQMREEGRTIVFVSHAMSMVRTFCSRAIWLHEGQVMQDGDVNSVTEAYQNFLQP